ncbi:hypothetical protein WA026_003105 [Henosepilachna vigintioctopunctata]|uniref:Palmitoyltransferase n=1 Tax=Henosepilachna vigintioctopunctata TaxID=420089 RepID=A0AAW1TIZ0_9CUCU
MQPNSVKKRENSLWTYFAYFSWIPVLLVSGIFAWSVYISIIVISRRPDEVLGIFSIIVFVTIFFMIFWSFLCLIYSTSSIIPEEFKLWTPTIKEQSEAGTLKKNRVILKDFAKNLPLKTTNSDGSIRYCEKCKHIKPDRCHHCSSCRTCILKMDHHCPWIYNCVSFSNYKFFFLFLFYSILGCLYIIYTTFSDGYNISNISELHGDDFQIVTLFYMAMLLCVGATLLLLYHFCLLMKNQTTVERIQKPVFKSNLSIESYNIGVKNNFLEVFGNNVILWWFPIFTAKGDGIHFPVRYKQTPDI